MGKYAGLLEKADDSRVRSDVLEALAPRPKATSVTARINSLKAGMSHFRDVQESVQKDGGKIAAGETSPSSGRRRAEIQEDLDAISQAQESLRGASLQASRDMVQSASSEAIDKSRKTDRALAMQEEALREQKKRLLAELETS